MKNLKFFIAIIILIIILLIALLFILRNQNVNNEEIAIFEQEQDDYVNTLNNPNLIINGLKPRATSNENIYLTVKNCIDTYMLYYTNKQSDAIYAILNKEFADEKAINLDNIYEKLSPIADKEKMKIVELYELVGMQSSHYEVKCSQNEKLYYFHIDIDGENKTFDVKEYTKTDYESTINTAFETTESQEKKIVANAYNKVNYSTLSESEIANQYLLDYVENALYDTKTAYESLDSTYKNAKFKTYEQFVTYINKNKWVLEGLDTSHRKQYSDFSSYEEYENYIKNLKTVSLDKYSIKNEKDYKQCICVDEYNNYYIFYITSPMQYTVILDTYTIDLPEFTAKYNNAKDEEKVSLNMQKFFEAINKGDYEYSYNKLDATYKSQNFKTVAEFEKYMKENFFEQNKISAGKGEKQGNVYLYNMTIKDASGKSKNTITKTFVMQLKEGTDFVMSFEVN